MLLPLLLVVVVLLSWAVEEKLPLSWQLLLLLLVVLRFLACSLRSELPYCLRQ
jgi:hypothetical protein